MKEGNVLFTDAFNTFYLRLYDVGHMVKPIETVRGNPAAATLWVTLFDPTNHRTMSEGSTKDLRLVPK